MHDDFFTENRSFSTPAPVNSSQIAKCSKKIIVIYAQKSDNLSPGGDKTQLMTTASPRLCRQFSRDHAAKRRL